MVESLDIQYVGSSEMHKLTIYKILHSYYLTPVELHRIWIWLEVVYIKRRKVNPAYSLWKLNFLCRSFFLFVIVKMCVYKYSSCMTDLMFCFLSLLCLLPFFFCFFFFLIFLLCISTFFLSSFFFLLGSSSYSSSSFILLSSHISFSSFSLPSSSFFYLLPTYFHLLLLLPSSSSSCPPPQLDIV